MEGFGDAPADGGSNPFDTGFDDTPAPSGLDAFGGPAPPAAAPLDNGFAAFGAAPEAQPATAFAPAPAAASGGGAPPLDDDFFGGGGSGGGAPPPSNSNGGAAQAAFESPRFDDPRIEWNHKNQSLLAQRAQAEVKAKAEVVNKAKAFLDKQAKVH
ncbi:hypothetical protein MNEG_8570 [Monoraphidium neglectum]|uniref:Clathrin light chain n=1 Tax=Monoraphidium neglectum TaxID=145388 RepID=A0A0D2KVH5_9CHLO|nr:hypothetical protein MNEG_8570 [Monoraphidium neglectum]KIY99388.1 hypothetical protein MNEG_8570 [Monoraphidium neglectum]|eukprot:XP_013898408.1 hypothetical protein MNEG_8570 [Monoraphidium neglectum]